MWPYIRSTLKTMGSQNWWKHPNTCHHEYTELKYFSGSYEQGNSNANPHTYRASPMIQRGTRESLCPNLRINFTLITFNGRHHYHFGPILSGYLRFHQRDPRKGYLFAMHLHHQSIQAGPSISRKDAMRVILNECEGITDKFKDDLFANL